MFFECDNKLTMEQFDKFVVWYTKHNPNFKGRIRRSARDLGIADIIDTDETLREYRFCVL